MPRPELGPIAVGDQLIVIRSYNRYRENDPIPVTVTKAARVWVELQQANEVGSMARTWRMRRDTQNEGSQYSNQDRFVTAAQFDWEQRAHAADQYLREQGMEFRGNSPWRSEERRLILANLLRAHDGLEPV